MSQNGYSYYIDKSFVPAKLKNFLQQLMNSDIPVIVGFAAKRTGDDKMGQAALLLKSEHRLVMSDIASSVNCVNKSGDVLFSFKEHGSSLRDTEYRPLLMLMGAPDVLGDVPFTTDDQGNLLFHTDEFVEIWKNS